MKNFKYITLLLTVFSVSLVLGAEFTCVDTVTINGLDKLAFYPSHDGDANCTLIPFYRSSTWLGLTKADTVSGNAPVKADDIVDTMKIMLKSEDGVALDTLILKITVKAWVFTSADSISVNEGDSLKYLVSHTGPQGATIQVYGSMPSWVNTNATHDTITGIAPQVTGDQTGTIILRIINGPNIIDSLALKITIKDLDVTGNFTSDSAVAVNEGANLDYIITHTGEPNATVQVVGTVASWITVDTATGKITGTAPQVTIDQIDSVNLKLVSGATTLDSLKLMITTKNVSGIAVNHRNNVGNFDIYPITRGHITGFMIEVPTKGLLTIKAYDISGKKLFSSRQNIKTIGKRFIPCNQMLKYGNFVVVLKHNGKVKVKKISVSK